MRVLTTFCAALLLTACASRPPLTTGVVRVPEPFPVPCVEKSKVPPKTVPPSIAADADIEQRAAWAKIYATQLRHEAAQMRALLIACTIEEVDHG